MRIATWNVNSIRARVVRTVDFAVREGIDVLAMQEIKCKPEQFPYEAKTRATPSRRTGSTSGTGRDRQP
jgi:exonuclease III